MKVAELTGVELDYWVARAAMIGWILVPENKNYCFVKGKPYSPSTNWADGGPIIEREKISVEWIGDEWRADIFSEVPAQYGETILIAAMRYYVYSKFGEEVPDEPVS